MSKITINDARDWCEENKATISFNIAGNPVVIGIDVLINGRKRKLNSAGSSIVDAYIHLRYFLENLDQVKFDQLFPRD